MSQMSLDTFSAHENKESDPMTFTDEHITYLWERSIDGIMEKQIQDKLLEEEAELEDYKSAYNELYGHENHHTREYIRVGASQ